MVHNLNSKELKRVNEGLAPWESMSFACGGWLQFYMFGVAKALQVAQYDKGVRYYGCSAGALTAVGLVVGGEYDDAIQFCKDYCVPQAYSDVSGLFQLSEYVTKCLELQLNNRFKGLPENSLNIAVTRLPFLQAERISKVDNQAELIEYLLASSAAFPFAPIRKVRDHWYIDGGLSDFQPIEDENTITVSPFYFTECDIKPSRYVPLWWTFLPPHSKHTIDWLYQLGMVDCVNYLKQRGLPLNPEVEMLLKRHHALNHPYKVKGRVSIQRFLGYEMNRFLSFFLDGILLLLLLFVWKPLALLLIYAELFSRIVLLTSFSVLQAAWQLYPPQVLKTLFLRPYYALMSRFMGAVFLHGVNLVSETQRLSALHELWECVGCVWSLSLFLRFLSGRPTEMEMKRHKRLAKFSVIYRVCMHII